MIKTALFFKDVQENSNIHRLIIDIYNTISPLPRGYSVKYNDAWCMTFTSFIAKICKIDKFPYECSCYKALEKAKLLNLKVDKNYKKGCLIFFKNNKSKIVNHVGFIIEVNNKQIKTIEGNSSNKVKINAYNLNDNRLDNCVHLNV